MKKITENALLYRVNQLKEKIAVYEAAGDGSMTPNPRALFPDQSPTATQRHADPTNAQGYNVKPAPVQPTTPPAGTTTTPPATPPAGTTTTPPAAPEGHWYDPAVNFAKGVGDDLSYAADHAAELGQGVGQTAANMAKSVGNAVDAAGNFIGGAVTGATGGTQGQQKIGAKQHAAGGAHPAAQHAGGAAAHHAAPDPKVLELQKKLIAQGYPIKADGIMGPKTQAAYEWQAKNDDMAAKMSAYDKPTAPGAPTAQTPATAPSTTAANMTPAFASQSPAAQASAMPPPEKQVYKESPEHVSFGEDDSLARLLQLVKW